MLENSKVVWKEGMFLQPQHFQQAERYVLDIVSDRFRAASPWFYGITGISIDRDALANSLFTLSDCSGILPDGISFDVPKKENLPPPRSFADHFTHEKQSLDVFLALPVVIFGKANAGSDSQGSFRFLTKNVGVVDEVMGTQKKEIEIGAYNFLILFGDESLDNHASLPIARLVRNASGQIVLDETFAPPLLWVGASPHIMNQMRSMLELLLARAASLSQGRKQVEGGFAEFSGSEETAFRLLGTLNTFTPLLNHHHLMPNIHPFELFSLLTQFTGALCTFSSKVSIRNLPRYDHHNFAAVIDRFVSIVRSVLEADISAGSVNLPIEQVRASTFYAKAPDPHLFASAKFFFGIAAANVAEKELIVGVVRRIKICSQAKLDLLISSAMPGVQLIHSAHPPEKLSTKPEFVYFSFDQGSELWKEIAATGVIALYFPHNYQDCRMEIIALKQ